MIFFISDWGYKSYYVGVAKSVIYSISSESKVIDITHDIEPFDVEEASHVIERVFDDLPRRSVLLCVVDPTVGTDRRPIIANIDEKYCVVPDNGVLTRLIELKSVKSAHLIENPKYMYKYPPSSTFHGRDIFAPAAAYLDKGTTPDEFGRSVKDLKAIKIEGVFVDAGKVESAVAYIDGFGNIETTIRLKDLQKAGISGNYMLVNGKRAILANNYSEGKHELILAHADSSNYIEISSSAGRASEILKLKKRDKIVLQNLD
ncbi:MAG: SAM-dependent chlorinase/fluorinase [Thermotogae bacterium]|jgi:S-adenosylmethionine hydrolase|nr:SAM-dependent chlorinase/fluorinase [Thermotogota bacterium]MCL5032039.1 SAM-dependent chlorinase/fluorinase [Thermotogota bacterium]